MNMPKYGFRAIIGAAPLKPARQDVDVALPRVSAPSLARLH